MGASPTKEKLLELIKKSCKSSKAENNYKLEFQIEQENEIFGGDEEPLYNDNLIFMSNINKVKDIKRFPYIAIGTITFKFSSNEYKDHTCFLIHRKVIVTLLSFLNNGKKNATEVTTTLTNEKLSIKNCAKYEKKNLAIFFLEENNCSQWIGVDEYLQIKKNIDKKDQKIYGQLKIIYSTGKGTKSGNENNAFINEGRDTFDSNIIPFLEEINFDENMNNLIKEQNLSKNKIIGGVICYKNQQNGGVYAVGIIGLNVEPIYFEEDTIKYLYEQVYKAKLSNSDGIDESNIVELDLSKKNIGPTHIKILTEFNLINLKKLNLLKNQIGPQGAFFLGQSQFSNLEILILNFNEIGDEGTQYLSKGPFLELKYLYLFHNNVSNIGVGYILDSIFIDTLLLLDLSDNPNIDGDGIDKINNTIKCNNKVFKELLCLNLSSTSINNDVALDKLNQIQFPKLQKLILRDIDFSKCNTTLLNKNYEIKKDE